MSSSSEVQIVSISPNTQTGAWRRRSRRISRPPPVPDSEVICIDDDNDNATNNNNTNSAQAEILNMGNSASGPAKHDDVDIPPQTAVKEEDTVNKENPDGNAPNKNNSEQPAPPHTAQSADNPARMDENEGDDDALFKDSNDGMQNTAAHPDANDPSMEITYSSDDLEELTPSEDERSVAPDAQDEFDQVPEPGDGCIVDTPSQPENAGEGKQVPEENSLPQKDAAAAVSADVRPPEPRASIVVGKPPATQQPKASETAVNTPTADMVPKSRALNKEHVGASVPKIAAPASSAKVHTAAAVESARRALSEPLVDKLKSPAPTPTSGPLPPSPDSLRAVNSGKETGAPKRKARELDGDNVTAATNVQVSPTMKRQRTSAPRTAVCDLPEAKTDLEAVSRKWQMASVVHFFATFYGVLPVEDVVGEENELDVSAGRLERAVAEPDSDPQLVYLLRDLIAVLLLALKRVTVKRARSHWFESLCAVAWARSRDFVDTNGSDAMRMYKNGTLFLVESPWPVRLAVLLTLCDLAAEEADCIRNSIVTESAVPNQGGNNNTNTSNGNNSPDREEKKKVDLKTARMEAFGRCTAKRWYFRVGTARIYSGFKRKGNGNLKIEADDSESMRKLIARLESSKMLKDQVLAANMRDNYLPQIVEKEEEEKKKAQTIRELKTLKMDSWSQKGRLKPRRRKQVYYV